MNLDFNKTKNSVSDGNKTKTTIRLEEMSESESGLEEMSESESQQVIGGVGFRIINSTKPYKFGGVDGDFNINFEA